MTALQSLETSVQRCERRIENAAANPADITAALREGCGVAEGYYLAGAVSKCEYDAACAYLRRVANQRLAIVELQQQAQAEGMA